jgi:O-antigen ligase
MRYFTALLLFTYFVLSGYTISENYEGAANMAGRITAADMLAVVMAVFGVVTLRKVVFTSEHFSYMCFLALALVGVFGARNPAAGAVELIALAFNWSVSLALLNLIINNRQVEIGTVVRLFVLGSTILAMAGLVQFFLIPNLFAEKSDGAVTGTFRNTGQAGAFFGVALAVAIPALMSGLIKRNALNITAIAITLTALLFTFKRAALIGLVIGVLLFALRLAFSGSGRDRKVAVGFLLLCLFAGPALYLLFQYSIENVASMRWRFEHKFREDALEDFSEGFLADNITATFLALNDHPLLGAGLGNIIGQYTTKYEIHSTYLAVLANTGLLGMALYLTFMGVWVAGLFKYSGKATVEERFLSYFMPFLVGLGVSWIYTYHLRKREFWIMFVFTLVCSHVVKKARAARRREAVLRSGMTPPMSHYQPTGWPSEATAGRAMRQQWR